jgi:hypothetical protein
LKPSRWVRRWRRTPCSKDRARRPYWSSPKVSGTRSPSVTRIVPTYSRWISGSLSQSTNGCSKRTNALALLATLSAHSTQQQPVMHYSPVTTTVCALPQFASYTVTDTRITKTGSPKLRGKSVSPRYPSRTTSSH